MLRIRVPTPLDLAITIKSVGADFLVDTDIVSGNLHTLDATSKLGLLGGYLAQCYGVSTGKTFRCQVLV
jgi:hypothetical protein